MSRKYIHTTYMVYLLKQVEEWENIVEMSAFRVKRPILMNLVSGGKNQTKTSSSIKGPFVLDKDLIKSPPVIAAWRHGYPTWKTS